jgi:hypothetical protein
MAAEKFGVEQSTNHKDEPQSSTPDENVSNPIPVVLHCPGFLEIPFPKPHLETPILQIKKYSDPASVSIGCTVYLCIGTKPILDVIPVVFAPSTPTSGWA